MENRIDEHGGHRSRLRARVEKDGLGVLQPHEVLEFLLCYAIPRQDVNALAHALLRKFGTLQAVLHALPEELMQVEGMGRRAALWIAQIGEATRASTMAMAHPGIRLDNFARAFQYALSQAETMHGRGALQICMDLNGHLLYQRIIAPCMQWAEPEYMREGLSDVLASSAPCVMLVLFPDVYPAETQAYDISHAQTYAHTLRSAGSTLMDVLIVDHAGLRSLRQAGHLHERPATEEQNMVCERYLRNIQEDKESET